MDSGTASSGLCQTAIEASLPAPPGGAARGGSHAAIHLHIILIPSLSKEEDGANAAIRAILALRQAQDEEGSGSPLPTRHCERRDAIRRCRHRCDG